jgi:hypothetical protein
VKQVLPGRDPFYAQLIDQVICADKTPDQTAVVTQVIKAACAKDTSLIEERKKHQLVVGCGRFDSRNRFIGFRGPYAELYSDTSGAFHLAAAGRYYASPRKEKMWLGFDTAEKLTTVEYYEVGVELDRLTVLDTAGRLIEAGKIRFSQLDAQYYRIGRWRRSGGLSDLIYDGKGAHFLLEDLKKKTAAEPRQLNVTMSKKRMFYPVQDGRVLLPVSCTKKQSYSWTGSAESFLLGMKPGEAVLVIDREGQDTNATLGALECFQGECGQHVLSVVLKTERPLTKSHFAVAQIGDGKSGPKTLTEAESFALIMKDQDFYEFLAGDSGRFLGLKADESQLRILEAEFSGICCPQAASFTEYEVPLRTRMPKIISTYTTPGQPCD